MSRKTGFLLFITILLVLSVPLQQVKAASKPSSVSIELPRFTVTLNGVQVDNSKREYPLIVYQDITYFPLTYYDSRFLGLETEWDGKNGLRITKTDVTGAYRDDLSTVRNKGKLQASIPSFAVKVNSKSNVSSEEKYPLLVFRDVTYFPLTWRFAVQEFGWDYSFDAKKGLVIQSDNLHMTPIRIPTELNDKGAVQSNGYLYYFGEQGAVYQAPVDRSGDKKKVYQLPIWSYGDGTTYVNGYLTVENGDVLLSYHQGSAIMGLDYYIRLNPDGTAVKLDAGYLTMKTIGDFQVKVNQGVPPSPGNLLVRTAGEEQYRSVGNPAYLYGWHWEKKGDSTGGGPSQDIYYSGGSLYLLAFHMDKDTDFSRIHKVDVTTGEVSRFMEDKISSFTLYGNMLYYIMDGKLYRKALDGGQAELFSFEGNAGTVTSIRADGGYLICTFEEISSNRYRLIVVDEESNIRLRTADSAQSISIDRGVLSYSLEGSNMLYTVNLSSVK